MSPDQKELLRRVIIGADGRVRKHQVIQNELSKLTEEEITSLHDAVQELWDRVTECSEDQVIRNDISKLTEEEVVALHSAVLETCDIKKKAGCFDSFHRLLYGVGCYLSHMIIGGKIRDDITPDKIDISFNQLHDTEIVRARVQNRSCDEYKL